MKAMAEAAAERRAPYRKAVVGVRNCHRAPAIRLAGRAASPTLVWKAPSTVPLTFRGESSET